jgi:soluble lytic murein transglycosylase-like protein
MEKRLQAILMASSVVAISLSLAPSALLAQDIDTGTPRIQATTDHSGRIIFTNDGEARGEPRSSAGTPAVSYQPRSRLVFWSATEHRWKPVPSAKVGAARSAAAEVNQLLNGGSGSDPGGSFGYLRSNKTFSEKEIDKAIEQAAERHNVDPNLVRSVIKVESNFNPNAVSRKGAMGLMQLMPQTARSLKVTNPFDPQQNVDAGVRHLKQLLENYGGDVRLTLAAYNAGSGAVARSAGIPRYSETQNYVRRITNLYYGGSEPGSHIIGNPVHDPVRVERDARGVLYISNTD